MKSAKNLIIPLIILVLLAAGVVVFFVVEKINKNKSIENTTVNTVDLLYVNPVDVASVSVLHRDGNINVQVDKASSNGNYIYTYLGNDKGQGAYSQSQMDTFQRSLSSFVGCVPVSDNADLAEYGLADPALTVTITKTDGSKMVILIGDLSPDKSSCYICAGASSSVYMISAAKLKSASMVSNDFLDSRIIDVTMEELESVEFVRKKDSLELLAVCVRNESTESYTFMFNKPFEIASSAYFDLFVQNVCSLSSLDFEDASNENLIKFGLAIPEHVVTLKLKNGKTYKIELSSNGAFYYGRLNGAGKIFKIASERIDLIESPLLVLINEFIFFDSSENVDSVECTGVDRRFVLKLDVAKGKTIADGDSTVSLDGRNAKISNGSGRSYAAMMFESIFSINIGGYEESSLLPETAVPDTSIKIYDRNHSAVVYDFYRRSDDTFYVYKDGKYTCFYIFKRELYNDGGTDTYNYGIWPAYEILTKAITNSLNGIYEIPADK